MARCRVVLSIEPISPSGEFFYSLPPSKSHMIRFMAMAAQGKKTLKIEIASEPGGDIHSMANCLEKMGVEIERGVTEWLIKPPKDGLSAPDSTLNCGNSGTVARIMTAIAACFDEEITIDGDESLRSRECPELAFALRELDVKVSSTNLPCTVCGPISGGEISLEMGRSSQPLTALILASPKFSEEVVIDCIGESVSTGYLEITGLAAGIFGSPITKTNDKISINSFDPSGPESLGIPPELSLYPMGILCAELHHELDVQMEIYPYDQSMIASFDQLTNLEGGELNLQNASDIISPAAAYLALKNGGRITGVAHARGKESNRIIKTVELLNKFGLFCKPTADGLVIAGGQRPKLPVEPVDTHGDHRLVMTAVLLATSCGGEIINPEVSAVTHPEFLGQIGVLSSL